MFMHRVVVYIVLLNALYLLMFFLSYFHFWYDILNCGPVTELEKFYFAWVLSMLWKSNIPASHTNYARNLPIFEILAAQH